MPENKITEKGTTQAIFLKNYAPPTYRVDNIDLHVTLEESQATIIATLQIHRANDTATETPLVLDGEALTLKSIEIDDRPLDNNEFKLSNNSLSIATVPSNFKLTLTTLTEPQNNTTLNGLYKSSGNFCTQCEAEGFRRITYFIDRPDNMSIYTTTIVAEQHRYPILLSNGNFIAGGELDGGLHWAKWHDPFPKPCYLFALVAGDLCCVQDTFMTRSQRRVTLNMYVQHGNEDQCEHAMNSLKHAMRWDEKVYGREYDLDIYNIVAVDDFNMGAMENKGLNIFNTKYVLARPETATDQDYQGIESVIAHEYFHNWSGNRVTCRDWFQLSLKEGFTVFRDQEFSADMLSRAIKRIDDVNILRTHQFREDAGPMAHPIRPASYVEINNFYTVTIYNKGAEVVRMLHHLLGADQFRKACDLYFDRHDGQAVTTDDFIATMEAVSKLDLTQFKLWYSQAGTPEVNFKGSYNPEDQTYTVTLTQHCPPSPGQADKKPFLIPVNFALLNTYGDELTLQKDGIKNTVLALQKAEETYLFKNITARPVPSILRGFSAPIKLTTNLNDDDLYFLMQNDSDEFCRWDASQQIAIKILLGFAQRIRKELPTQKTPIFLRAFNDILSNDKIDHFLKCKTLSLPNENYLVECMSPLDPLAAHKARLQLMNDIAHEYENELLVTYKKLNETGSFKNSTVAMGKRALKNLCLCYLMALDKPEYSELCLKQIKLAHNMTDVLTALSTLAHSDCSQRLEALDIFYHKWKHEPLVMDKWLTVQATSRLPNTLNEVKNLIEHPIFSITNPNKVRALIGAFCNQNPFNFHAIDGSGYLFAGDSILKLDPLNPQIAARLSQVFSSWKQHQTPQQELMKNQLQRILKTVKLSRDVSEIIEKSLRT